MSYADYQEEDRRLVLLRGLLAAAQYRANAFLLRHYCDRMGHAVSADRLETDLSWLSEQGLLGRERAHEVTVVTLTARGMDVAEGRTHVPGVARPQPGV